VFVPALYEGLDANITGDDSLQYDPVQMYTPNPFSKALHIGNSGTVNLEIDSVVVEYADLKILNLSALRRDVLQSLKPGDGLDLQWSFQTRKRDTTETTEFNLIIYHGAGTVPMKTAIWIPGRKTAFNLANVFVPSQLALDPSDTGYVANPFSTRFSAFNDDWMPATFVSSHVTIAGTSVTALSPLDRAMNEVVAPNQTSAEIFDSFYVKPSTEEQVLTFFIQIENSSGLTDTASYFIYVPKIKAPEAIDHPDPASLLLESVFPNPDASDILNISINLKKPSLVTFEVFDQLGKNVATIQRDVATPGRHTLQWRHEGAPAGFYFLQMRTTDGIRTARFFISK
jgi:hypothetical protein